MLSLHSSKLQSFDFDDVILVPKECVVQSRSEVNVSTVVGGRDFKLPVIPANMSTILNVKTAEWLASRGYFYIMHRFDVDPVEFVRDFNEKGLVTSISVGVKDKDYADIARLKEAGLAPDYATVDIAHGHAASVSKMIKALRGTFPSVYVIAGNVATPEAALDLVAAGAHAVKVGIGPGASCLTAPNTGFGTRGWQLAAVAAVADALKHTSVNVIADGGIRQYGDIAKAIAFGADLVMVGGMFGGHDENPGEVIEQEGKKFKEFFGSASEYQKGEKKHVEGKRMLVPYRGSLADSLQAITDNLQSAVSYAGGTELGSLREVSYVLAPQ